MPSPKFHDILHESKLQSSPSSHGLSLLEEEENDDKAAKVKASENGRRDSNHYFGCNPCSEIILRPYQFCNLSEVVVRQEDTLETLKQKGHKDVTYLKNHSDIANLIAKKKDSFDILITQGAGSVSKVCEAITDKWKR